jgi:hypothetical protein
MALDWECDCSYRSGGIGRNGSHQAAAKLASGWEEHDPGNLIDSILVGQNFDEKNAVIPNG